MFSTSDTIVAIATPPGRGGIGVVRISGPEAHSIARALTTYDGAFEPRRATFTYIHAARIRLKPDSTGTPVASACRRPSPVTDAIDHVLVTYFPAPASYTGDDVVEISAHGSPVVLRAVVSAAVDAGARLAQPGEFTLRAFVNRRIDLMQAEAVADLIDSVTPLQARAAFDQLQGTLTRTIGEIDSALFDLIARLEASVDFPDEGYHFIDPGSLAQAIDSIATRTATLLTDARRGRLVREGLQIAIVGNPNVGKSSLFNALVGASRAIVTEIPGTTRDFVTETVDLDGLRVTLVDTAGLCESTDLVEIEGAARSKQVAGVADLILVVSDQSRSDGKSDQSIFANANVLQVVNKADLAAAWTCDEAVCVSAVNGSGLTELRRRIAAALDIELLADRPAITNVRHIALVQRAYEAMVRARDAALTNGQSLSEEFVLADLQDARAALEEVTGRRAPEVVLEHIFSRFCIGK